MQLGPIALSLRLGSTRFGNRIAGAAELAFAIENTLTDECAFVVPLSDICPANNYDSGINQKLVERFGVIVAIKNDSIRTDKTGITAFDVLHTVRGQIWSAILNYHISGAESNIYYVGGNLLKIDRAWMWYQFEFEYTSRITDSDGVAESDTDELEEIYTQLEMTPSVNIPYDDDLPVTAFSPDMTTYIDLTDDPNDGPFSWDFSEAFDINDKDEFRR